MNDSDGHIEANIARLIEAACGEDALLDSSLKERTWRQLKQRMHLRRSALTFSDRAVASLGFALAGTAAWLAFRVAGAGIEEALRLPGLLVLLPLGVNLALVPVAAVVIFQGRRDHDE